MGYTDGPSMYQGFGSSPMNYGDPYGLNKDGYHKSSAQVSERQATSYREAKKRKLERQLAWVNFEIDVREAMLGMDPQNRKDELRMLFQEAGADFDTNMALIEYFAGKAGMCEGRNGRFHCGLQEAARGLDGMIMTGQVLEIGLMAGAAVGIVGRAGFRTLARRVNGYLDDVPFQFSDAMSEGVLGTTGKYGNIKIRRDLSVQEFLEVRRHEAVHRFLSPKRGGRLNELRADARMAGYRWSEILTYGEEALAETFATKSLSRGLAFPIVNGYVSPLKLSLEVGIFGSGPAAMCAAYASKR